MHFGYLDVNKRALTSTGLLRLAKPVRVNTELHDRNSTPLPQT